jgi:transposase
MSQSTVHIVDKQLSNPINSFSVSIIIWTEPPEKPIETIGRPIVPFRKEVLDGILYVMRTGCQWKMLPKAYGSASTCHRRFQEWVGKRRVFEKLWIRLLEIYDDIRGIEWEWQSLDSVSVKAPLEFQRRNRKDYMC